MIYYLYKFRDVFFSYQRSMWTILGNNLKCFAINNKISRYNERVGHVVARSPADREVRGLNPILA